MDKKQKSTATQHKTEDAAHSGKESAKHDTSSKKMMDEKSNSKSEKAMHASSDKGSKGK